MALSPTFKASLTNSKKLTITDTTGVYSATNTGGWGTPNSAGADVTLAVIIITFPSGASQTIDVTSQIADAVTGEFSYNQVTLESYEDGLASLVYRITVGDSIYTKLIRQLYSIDVRKCVNQMWVKIACETCNGNCDLVNLIDDANLAEGLYKALVSGAACCTTDDGACIAKILTALKNLCSWKDCNC